MYFYIFMEIIEYSKKKPLEETNEITLIGIIIDYLKSKEKKKINDEFTTLEIISREGEYLNCEDLKCRIKVIKLMKKIIKNLSHVSLAYIYIEVNIINKLILNIQFLYGF